MLRRLLILLGMIVVTTAAGGCVRRTVTIVTEPPGALVWMNDREVGRTPLNVEFLYYGTYDVRLELDGYEPVTTAGDAKAPWWDIAGPDFVAELWPGELHSKVLWQYQLEPLDNDRDALLGRAQELRELALSQVAGPDAAADEADEAAGDDENPGPADSGTDSGTSRPGSESGSPDGP